MKHRLGKNVSHAALYVGLLGMAISQAHAGVTEYNVRNLFDDATTSQTNISFDDFLSSGVPYQQGITIKTGGVDFSNTVGGQAVLASSFANVSMFGSGAVYSSNYGGSVTNNAKLDTATHAVGMELFAQSSYAASTGGAMDVTVELFDTSNKSLGSYTVKTTDSTDRKFVGFVSDTGISKVAFTNNTGSRVLFMDNFVYGSPAVPEPAFYQMSALLSLGGLGILRLRRKKA